MNERITYRPASEVEQAAFVNALNQAYSDYFVPIYLTPHSFQRMLQRESVDMDASVAALEDNQIIGMGLLGIREQRGWIGGMGVVKSHRRRGVARQVMQYLMHNAHEHNLETLQLEVIRENQAAHELYFSLGFEVVRELMVLSLQDDGISTPVNQIAPTVHIAHANGQRSSAALNELSVITPPWQREVRNDMPLMQHMRGLIARDKDEKHLLGSCLYLGRNLHAEIMGLAAVNEMVGTGLLAHLIQQFPTTNFTYLNVTTSDPMLPALQSAGFSVTTRQYEMQLTLN